MIFSVTELQTLRRCRWKWNKTSFNRQGLEPIRKKPALSLGGLVHQACADWIGDPTTNLKDTFMHYAMTELEELKANYSTLLDGLELSASEAQQYMDEITLGSAMMENYQNFWKQPLLPGFVAIAPEQCTLVSIPNTEHCETPNCFAIKGPYPYPNATSSVSYPACFDCGNDLVSHQLEATLDAIIANERGDLFVLERKTYARRPNIEELTTNDQFLAYTYVLHRLAMSDALPSSSIGGVAYDGLWKRDKPPKGSSMDDLFLRTLLLRPSHELESFERQLTETAKWAYSLAILPMDDDHPRIDINRTYDCWYTCDFHEWCKAHHRGEDTSYLQTQFKPRERTRAFQKEEVEAQS